MSDQSVSDETLREIIFECKQLIQQLDGLSILFTEKSKEFTDELYIREQRSMELSSSMLI